MKEITDVKYRNLKETDNKIIASIIRNSLLEFKAAKPGTVYFDPTTDDLYTVFKKEKCAYFIVELNGHIVGGGGIYPTENLPEKTCELVKLYLAPQARGLGIGKTLIEKCIQMALSYGYNSMYLETMPELKFAVPLYEKFGFTFIDAPLGNNGHCGCDLWMLKGLES
jgi:putative acetyltransferase